MASKDGTKVVDEVARQALWAEVIRKENAAMGDTHKFFLNPNKLVFLARKPTEIDPRTYEIDSISKVQRAAAGAVHKKTEKTQKTGANHDALDLGGVKLWKTVAQELGSFYGKDGDRGIDPFTSRHSSWWSPISRCDVTEYGDRYYEMAGVSPFARKNKEKPSAP